jgi:hypothetical protein
LPELSLMDGMFGEMKLRVVSLFKMAHNARKLALRSVSVVGLTCCYNSLRFLKTKITNNENWINRY